MMGQTPPAYPRNNGHQLRRPQDARRSNLALILQSLYDQPKLSRAELARRTGLSKVTISDLVAELIDDGLVAETGQTLGAPGKPGVSLCVRDDTRDIIALDLAATDTIVGGVYSLTGDRRRRKTWSLSGTRGEETLNAVLDVASDLAKACRYPVLGVGVGTPGTVDSAGRVLSAPNLSWTDVDLPAILAERLGVPAIVANDANAAVVAEQAFDGAPDSLIRIQISGGVGAGLVIGGSVVFGSSYAAGEIGHVVVDPDGDPCSCGKRGCLETVISVPALTRAILAAPGRRDAILARAGDCLGATLAPIVGMLDLPVIVLGGPEALLGGVFTDAVQAVLAARAHSEFRSDVALRASALGDDAVLLGAVALVLRHTLGVT